MRHYLALAMVLLVAFLLVRTIINLEYGYFDRDATWFYLWNGFENTGSANLVNGIVWDFRSYDTMGEELILLSAVFGVMLVLGRFRDG